MTDRTQTLQQFTENKYEQLCAKIYQTVLEDQVTDLRLDDEDWKLLRKAKPAHMERQPEMEY